MIKRSSGLICCLLAAFFWGTTFVAQDAAAATIPAFTFLALRSFVGAGALLLLFLIKDKWGKGEALCPPDKDRARLTVFGGGEGAGHCGGLFLAKKGLLFRRKAAATSGSNGDIENTMTA